MATRTVWIVRGDYYSGGEAYDAYPTEAEANAAAKDLVKGFWKEDRVPGRPPKDLYALLEAYRDHTENSISVVKGVFHEGDE